jgi:hypothetical protein
MKKHLLLYLIILIFNSEVSIAQCNGFANQAVPSGDTLHCVGGNYYKTAVAYNPVKQLYYSVNAGGSTPNEVFDIDGINVGSSVSVDWRGLWWNSNQNVLEGNTWDNYFIIDSLQSNGYLGGTTHFLGTTTPPNVQSAGTYDASQDLIYYYNNGTLYGESRSGFTDITPIALTGVSSFADVISFAVFYYDCPGNEIVLFENGSVNKRLLFFNKSTGVLATTVSFPSTLANIAYTGGNVSFANNIVWMFNNSINKWIGYDILESVIGVQELEKNQILIHPNPASSIINIEMKEQAQVLIVNVLGEVLKTEFVDGLSKLDITSLIPGIYFIQDSKSGKAVKFIKE